jgi:holo-[acyl-carrier protein] synthase
MIAPTPVLADLADRHLTDALSCVSDGPGTWDLSSTLRVGIDLTAVAEVAESVERFGLRYVGRIFTPHEVASCRRLGPDDGTPSYSFESMAARFAAKEAVVKVLRPIGPRPEWRAIEVHRAASGWTEIRLSGTAALLASRAGIAQMALSLTHQGSMAAAVVVGVCHGSNRPVSRQTPSNRREV